MYKQIIGLTLLAIATVSYAQVTGWTDCGSTTTIHEIRAGACTVTPCEFVRNNTYIVSLRATANAPASSLPFVINATMLGLSVTIMEGNACDQLACPTVPGNQFEFSYSYSVSDMFPPILTTATTFVFDQLQTQVICFSLPIQIR